MSDAEKALRLWRELKDDPRVEVIKVGKIELRKSAKESTDEYDLRVVKL